MNLVPGSIDWKSEFWSDSVTADATGAVLGSDGKGYFYANHNASSFWSNDTRTTGIDAATGAATITDTTASGGTSSSDASMSDSAANLPAAPTASASTSSASASTAPAASPPVATGTSFFTRSFSNDSFSALDSITYLVTTGAILLGSSHTGNTGSDGARYYVSSTNTTSGNTLTQSLDYERSGTYDNGTDATVALSTAGLTETDTTHQNKSGSILTDTQAITINYHTNTVDLTEDGTLRIRSSLSGPSAYSNQKTESQTYLNDTLTADTLTYRNTANADSTLFVGNNATYTARNSALLGIVTLSTTTGFRVNVSSATLHSDSLDSGVYNALANTNTVNNNSHDSNSGWSLASDVSTRTSTVGSATKNSASFTFSSGFANSDSRLSGNINSAGTQTSGLSYDHSDSSSNSSGSDWARLQSPTAPTTTAIVRTTGRASRDGTLNVTYAADGAPTGSLASSTNNATTADTTSNVTGALTAPDFSVQFNDYSHNFTKATNTSALYLALSASSATGLTTSGSTFKSANDYRLLHTTDLSDGLFYSRVRGNGSNSVETVDGIIALIGAGAPAPTRTYIRKQKNDDTSDTLSNGRMSDAQGHTGRWNSNANATVHIDDRLTLGLTLDGSTWTESSRSFAIDHTNSARSNFHQDDNGLSGTAPFPTAPVGATATHVLDVHSTSSSELRQNGTPANFSFTINNASRVQTDESGTGSWQDFLNTQTGNYSRESHSIRDFHDHHTGTSVNGTVNESIIDLYNFSSDRVRSDAHFVSLNQINNTHNLGSSSFSETRRGTTAAGTGNRTFTSRSAMWWDSTDRRTGQVTNGGNSTPSLYSPPSVDLSWPRTTPAVENPSPFWQGWNDGRVMLANVFTFGRIDAVRNEANRLATQYPSWVTTGNTLAGQVAMGAVVAAIGVGTFGAGPTALFAGAGGGLGALQYGATQIDAYRATGIWNGNIAGAFSATLSGMTLGIALGPIAVIPGLGTGALVVGTGLSIYGAADQFAQGNIATGLTYSAFAMAGGVASWSAVRGFFINELPPLMEPPGGAILQTPVAWRGGIQSPVGWRGGLQNPIAWRGGLQTPVGWRSGPLLAPETAAARYGINLQSLQPTRTVAGHAAARPYINSPYTIRNIIESGTPVPDPGGVVGGLRWDVPGSFRGRPGTFELVINPTTNRILHLLFRSAR